MKRYTPSATNVLIKDSQTGQFLDAEGIAIKMNLLDGEITKGHQRESYISEIKRKHKKRKKKIKTLERRIFILEKMVIAQDNEDSK